MYAENAATMKRFLAQFVEGGDFADVPMRDDVRFTGPLASATTSDGYRSICKDFADAVQEVSVRSMIGDDDVVTSCTTSTWASRAALCRLRRLSSSSTGRSPRLK